MDYNQQNMEILRIATRDAGWTGADMLDANKSDVVSFLTTGKRPTIRFKTDGCNLALSRRPATIAELIDLLERITREIPGKSGIIGNGIPGKSNKRECSKRGRPKADMPDDTAPLVSAIAEAFRQGRPFRKTGGRGVHENRMELPAPFTTMGKHQLSALVDELLVTGLLKRSKGGDLTPC